MDNATDEFAIPSPKRIRVEEPDSSEMVDDLDDIYAPSPIKEKSVGGSAFIALPSPNNEAIAAPSQAPQLPGLGTFDTHTDKPRSDAVAVEDRSPKCTGPTGIPIAYKLDDGPEREPNELPVEVGEIVKQDIVQELVPDVHVAEADVLLGTEIAETPGSNTDRFEDPNQGVAKRDPENLQDGIAMSDSPGGRSMAATENAGVILPDSAQAIEQAPQEVSEVNKTNADAEFEMDSSPLEVSSSDSSDDSSSSDGSTADDYKLLDPEEQARRLMAEDGGSDDEGGWKGVKPAGPLRTTNEKPDEVVPKPDIILTDQMKIEELGRVENIVENLVLIKARTSGEYQVLEYGSVLCLEDRTVIGAIAETLGRVQQPYYSVRFTNPAAIADTGITKDTQIFYVEQHSTYIFTQPLKSFKGSDASNIHDEEVADDELEFSDDEAEAEHKRQIKQQRQARRGGRETDAGGFSRGPRGRGRGGPRQRGASASHPHTNGMRSTQEHPPREDAALNYDDADGTSVHGHGDGLYTPLARPTNLHEMMERQDPPIETQINGFQSPRGTNTRGRGRGDRGSDRGRGRGRGQFNTNRGGFGQGLHGNGHAQPPTDGFTSFPQSNTFPAPSPGPHQSPAFPLPHAQQSPNATWGTHDSNSPQQQQLSLQNQGYSPYPLPQAQYNPFPSQGQQQEMYPGSLPQAYHAPQQAATYAMMPANIPPGAHINPAFFRQQGQNQPSQSWQQQQQQHGYGNHYNGHS